MSILILRAHLMCTAFIILRLKKNEVGIKHLQRTLTLPYYTRIPTLDLLLEVCAKYNSCAFLAG